MISVQILYISNDWNRLSWSSINAIFQLKPRLIRFDRVYHLPNILRMQKANYSKVNDVQKK